MPVIDIRTGDSSGGVGSDGEPKKREPEPISAVPDGMLTSSFRARRFGQTRTSVAQPPIRGCICLRSGLPARRASIVSPQTLPERRNHHNRHNGHVATRMYAQRGADFQR